MAHIRKGYFLLSGLLLMIVACNYLAECTELIKLISKLSETCSQIETIPRQTPGDLTINSVFTPLKGKSTGNRRINQKNLNRINRKIGSLLEKGFARAEDILNEENKVALQRGNPPKHSTSFHSRGTTIEDKALSACRALGILETTKQVAKSLKLRKKDSSEVVQQLLKPVKLPEQIPKGLQEICNEEKPNENEIKNCKDYKYRRCDGVCNNLENIFWGAAGIPHKRYLFPIYEDGIDKPPMENLPNPRQLSNDLNLFTPPQVCDDSSFQCVIITQMLKAFGQFLDHDMTRTPETIASVSSPYGSNGLELECCNDGKDPTINFPDCLPIDVEGDPIFPSCKICLRFVRSLPADTGIQLGHREQMNAITSYIDASNVYGSHSKCHGTTDPLRSFVDGKMLETDQYPKGEGCMPSMDCQYPYLPETSDLDNLFIAGDERVNEQPSLTSLHTLFVRYHNIIATLYKEIYDEDDETIYQETRRLVIAVMQHIVYKEFLPIVLSPSVHEHYGLVPLQDGYFDEYNPNINPTTANVFATAAYRFGHSLIGDIIKGDETVPLEECFFRNEFIKTEPFYPSKILHQECRLESKPMDVFLVDAVRNKLFADESIGFQHGTDLFALNVMRGRDHGLPGYNKWREFCGLKPFKSYKQLYKSNIMDDNIVSVFENHYENINDVEIFPAGIAEYPLKQGVVGETFACILGNQFRELKYGDRFWYESNTQPNIFKEEQLKAIRGTTLASVLCEGTSITNIQPYPFLKETMGNFAEKCSTITQNTLPDLLREQILQNRPIADEVSMQDNAKKSEKSNSNIFEQIQLPIDI